jgi:molecular chaperone GrpE
MTSKKNTGKAAKKEKVRSADKKKSPFAGRSREKTKDGAQEPSAKDKAADGVKPAESNGDNLEGKLLRLQADFDNFRKRMVREKGEVWQRSAEDIIGELLPVLDHMDLALEAATDHDAPDAFTEGFRLVRKQMASAMQKFGLAPIEADGEVFDPNLHEAVSHLASEDVEENKIIAQTRKGYMLREKLLRASQVVVSSGSPEPCTAPVADAIDSVESANAEEKGRV